MRYEYAVRAMMLCITGAILTHNDGEVETMNIPDPLVQRLLELQDLRDHNLETLKEKTKHIDAHIHELQAKKAEYEKAYQPAIDKIENEISLIQNEILNSWDGKTKTIHTPRGTLKFITTSSLRIHDETALYTELNTHLPPEEIVKNYLKGFKITPLRSYLKVHSLPEEVVSTEYKTTAVIEK